MVQEKSRDTGQYGVWWWKIYQKLAIFSKLYYGGVVGTKAKQLSGRCGTLTQCDRGRVQYALCRGQEDEPRIRTKKARNRPQTLSITVAMLRAK